MNEDAELLRRFAETHAEDAFAQLVQRHLGLVYHTALRRTNGDAHLAQDIAQQVFTTLAKDARTLSRHAVLSGWLYVTTRHLAANVMRAEHRRKQREEAAHRLQETLPATSAAAWDQLRPELDAVMDELSGPDRDAVLLRFFEDQSYAHIGATLDISEDAARMRVDRALDKLRSLLAHRGIESTAAALGTVLIGHAAGAAPAGLATSVTGTALGSLTVATAGAATAGTLWTFMTTTKTLAGAAAGLTLMGIGAGLYEASGFSPAEKEIAALRSQLNQVSTQARPATSASSGSTESAGAPATPGSVVEPKSPTVARAAAPVVSPLDALADNPEYGRISLEMYKSDLSMRMKPFYRKMNWSAEKIAALDALQIEMQQITHDIMVSIRAQGLSLTDPILQKMRNESQEQVNAKIRELLGASDHEALTQFNRRSAARRSIEPLITGLFYSESPLNPDQADRLTEIVHTQTGQANRVGFIGTLGQTDWDAVATAASEFLQPEQIAALRSTAQRQRAQKELSDLQTPMRPKAPSSD